jgi:hypothetical protein
MRLESAKQRPVAREGSKLPAMSERDERLARYKRALLTVRRRSDGFPVSEEDAAEANALLREARANPLPRAEAEELLTKILEHARTKGFPGLPAPGRATEAYVKRMLDRRDANIARLRGE